MADVKFKLRRQLLTRQEQEYFNPTGLTPRSLINSYFSNRYMPEYPLMSLRDQSGRVLTAIDRV